MAVNKTGQLDVEQLSPELIQASQLPGPQGMPLLGNLLQLSPPKLHRIVEKWSRRYGSIFKIKLGSQLVVVITNPEAIQYILKNRPDKFRRLAKMDEIIREMGFSGVFNEEGEEWKRQRKLVSQALNMSHLTLFFPTLVSITEKLFNRWTRLASQNESLEIKQELMRYTIDITSRLAFGYNMNTIENDNDIIQDHLENIFPEIYKRVNLPIPYWRFFKLPADKRIEKSLDVIVKTMQGVIDEIRRQLDLDPGLRDHPTNFLQALIAQSDQAGAASNHLVIGNVLTMMLAGEDTTAHTLTWICYFMHLHPGVQEKMREEVDRVLGNKKMLSSFEETIQFPYLQAVAYEAMRLKPVAPLLFFDAIADVVVNDIKIEKNTPIFLQTLYSATHEDNFSRPVEFIPDRWIAGKCPYLDAHNDRAFLPFGAGPRFCPGYNLAMIEITAVLAMMCRNFTIEMETDPAEVKEFMAFTMMPTSFMVKLVKRQEAVLR